MLVYRITGKKYAFDINGTGAAITGGRWNKKGTKLATASDALRIWNKKGKLVAQSKSTDDYLWGIDWSPDGKYIVTTSRKGVITIWDKKANKLSVLNLKQS